ncbi:universal stress protein [Halococcus qingdaonensis]|uniref:universal stress protein n=1 Tax=Halococcus qingdaonensis TaxID=224402 RepID=UPI00211726AA|nr:universal stress protein [Halococcus qingdaonensis]
MVIIAAVDRSDRASKAIKEAESLSTAFDDTIQAVHALTKAEMVKMDGVHATRPNIQISDGEVREAATEAAASAIADLDVSAEPVGLIGNPKSRIVEYAVEQNARYIVVAGRKRSPAGKTAFGSVTQSVILNSECPTVVSIDQ